MSSNNGTGHVPPTPPPAYTWRGGPLHLRAGGKESPIVAKVNPGAAVQVVGTTENGILVAFPPAPYLLRLGPEHYQYLQAPAAASSDPVVAFLQPDRLLALLAHPALVPAIQHLVATQPEAAKAAALPLVSPLLEALVPAQHLPMVRMALTQFGIP